MVLVDPRGMVASAYESGRAVVAGNVSTVEMVRGLVGAAEEAGRPLLIQFNRAGLRQIGGVEIAAAVVQAIAGKSDAEFGLHLDHADSLQELSDAINVGFGSVMIDGSTLPLERHVQLAQSARGLVVWSGLSLEAELGHVAGTEEGVTIGEASWTDPDEAAEFVSATGVDWLAVAVGNVHGGAPIGGLHVERLRAIRERVEVPLVLHGASGLGEAELQMAAELGVAKINVGTALHEAMAEGMRGSLLERPGDLRRALRAGEAAVREVGRGLLLSGWAVG